MSYSKVFKNPIYYIAVFLDFVWFLKDSEGKIYLTETLGILFGSFISVLIIYSLGYLIYFLFKKYYKDRKPIK